MLRWNQSELMNKCFFGVYYISLAALMSGEVDCECGFFIFIYFFSPSILGYRIINKLLAHVRSHSVMLLKRTKAEDGKKM